MIALSLKTYAKINLCIDVLRKREDGYHDVEMIMQQIDLFDRMTVRAQNVAKAVGDKIIIKTNKRYIPTNQKNTAYQAAQRMINIYREKEPSPVSVRIDIQKNIPVAAGLAGGSGNAAGVILALNKLWGLGLSLKQLMDIGQEIGADVPFCIMGQAAIQQSLGVEGGATCALARGTGVEMEPLPGIDCWVVLTKPPVSVSTAAVYGKLDIKAIDRRPDVKELIQGLKSKDWKKIKNNMINVLETVTIIQYPEVSKIKIIMEQGQPEAILMSGSGPTVFAIYFHKNNGQELYLKMKELYQEVFIVKTLAN